VGFVFASNFTTIAEANRYEEVPVDYVDLSGETTATVGGKVDDMIFGNEDREIAGILQALQTNEGTDPFNIPLPDDEYVEIITKDNFAEFFSV
jgi:hypothetical protein